jgi:hypothetical protein
MSELAVYQGWLDFHLGGNLRVVTTETHQTLKINKKNNKKKKKKKGSVEL